jgi:hypothetical protein
MLVKLRKTFGVECHVNYITLLDEIGLFLECSVCKEYIMYVRITNRWYSYKMFSLMCVENKV